MVLWAFSRAGRRHIGKEIRYIDAKRFRYLKQLACANAVYASLVFLDLLEGQTEPSREIGLRHTPLQAQKPDTPSYQIVNRVNLPVHCLPQ